MNEYDKVSISDDSLTMDDINTITTNIKKYKDERNYTIEFVPTYLIGLLNPQTKTID